jgi:hypothetical protein
MSSPEKPDATRFRQFLSQLREEAWMSPVQRSWSRFLFHQSNVDNAVWIIKEGQLLSRAEAMRRGLLRTDSGSPSVISQTDERWKNYARLYFRPRNPTFYHVEGFRRAHEYQHGSRCPVPVMFLFDMEEVLCDARAEFSSGNLAKAGAAVYSRFEDFEQLPFRDIYHEGPILVDKERVIFHRNAEVVFPDALPLAGFLRGVFCRSAAERDTLLFLLKKENVATNWQVNASQRGALFYKRWLHVDRVQLGVSDIKVELSQPPNSLPIKVLYHIEGNTAQLTLPSNFKEMYFRVKFQPTSAYTVQIFIAGDLAYANEFSESDAYDDLPF